MLERVAMFSRYRLSSALAAAAVSSGLLGCAVDASDDSVEPIGTTSSALSQFQWNPRNVRRRDGACRFEDSAAGPADAFVIASGNDVSIIFTRLGEATRVGPRGRRTWSLCHFDIPIEISPGSYLAGWSQSIQYGIVKPAGVRAGLGLESRLSGRAQLYPLPSIAVPFEKDAALDVPLAVATPRFDVFSRQRSDAWQQAWCKRNRSRELDFSGTAYTWTERTKDNVVVKIAIDGLDAHIDLGAVVNPCP